MNLSMNLSRAACFAAIAIALLLASTRSSAQSGPRHPHPPMRVPVPQPIAPSSLPDEAHRYGDDYRYRDDYGDDYRYAIDHERYEYDMRGPCIAQDASQHSAPETSDSTASGESVTPHAIDWCALAPYQPRYAPQIPASWWWWYRDAPWRYGRTR